MAIKKVSLVSLSFLILFSSCVIETADTVFINGSIWTGVDGAPRAEAIAIKGESLMAVGSNDELNSLKGPVTSVIDLEGKFVVPGMMDAHTHFMEGGFQLLRLNFRDVDSPEDFIFKIDSMAQTLEVGEWILGGNWDHEKWGGELPHVDWVEDVSKDHPVYVHRVDLHMAFANSKAMELAGITPEIADPEGGVIDRDHLTGNPTGILRESEAKVLVERVIPNSTDDDRRRAFQKATDYALSMGITQIHNMCNINMCTWEDLQIIKSVHAEGGMRMRVYAAPWWTDWEKLSALIEENGKGDDWLRWAAVKAQMDGSLGSRTAWMHDPYKDDPSTSGVLVEPDTTVFKRMMYEADAAGIQLAIHAIGTRANEWLLDQFQKIQEKNGERPRRNRLEHAQHLRQSEIPRFGREHVIASVQPFHIIDDSRWAHKRINEDVLKGTYAFRSLLEAGATLAFGSDWTVAPISPILGIYGAVTRYTIDGSQPDGWYPEERLTVKQSLKAHTYGVAFAAFQEDVLGTLEAGKLADFVILSDDLFMIQPQEIKNVGVLRTVVGGKTQFLSDEPGGKKPIWH